MNAAQKLSPNQSNISMDRNPVKFQPVDNDKLDMLLADAACWRLDTFEQVHAMLYPLIFNYARLFPVDSKAIDEVLVDAFFYCWKNWFASANELKIEIIKRLRSKITVILEIERKQNGLPEMAVPQPLENEFLKRFMRLSDEDIAEVSCKYAA